jgi:hypothetical protein
MARAPRYSDTQPSAPEQRRWHQLLQELGGIGFFRRGTLLHLSTRCGTPACRCHADPPHLHGPYWQWTRKIRGKTVTVTLSPDQAALLRTWLDSGRRLDHILAGLDTLSKAVTDRLLAAASPR